LSDIFRLVLYLSLVPRLLQFYLVLMLPHLLLVLVRAALLRFQGDQVLEEERLLVLTEQGLSSDLHMEVVEEVVQLQAFLLAAAVAHYRQLLHFHSLLLPQPAVCQ